jgi:hypothetical protein
VSLHSDDPRDREDPTDPRLDPEGPPQTTDVVTYAEARRIVFERAMSVGEASGAPFPHPGKEVIHAKNWNPDLAALNIEPRKVDSDIEPSNYFWSSWKQRRVAIYQRVSATGRRYATHILEKESSRITSFTIGWGSAHMDIGWGVYEEKRARIQLKKLLKNQPEEYRSYWMTGWFMEASKRSGLWYIFRRLRPTVVISPGQRKSDAVRVLCTLCMHPVAYYGNTFAGALCPTDDVIAHLVTMRADEHFFWRKSRQHHPDEPQSGL